MTKREFLELVISGTVNEDVIAHAHTELEKLDLANAKKKEKPSKTSIENEPIKANIMELLTNANGKMTASDIANALQISVQKASALCRQLVDGGKLEVEEIKVPKKGKQKAYGVIAG